MKQHITVKQFNELSKEGRKEYLDWCIKKGLYEKKEQKVYSGGAVVEGTIPFLSIGQMIELLRDSGWHGEDFAIARTPKAKTVKLPGQNIPDTIYPMWWCGNLSKWNKKDKYLTKHSGYGSHKICDALWQATKEILNLPLDKH